LPDCNEAPEKHGLVPEEITPLSIGDVEDQKENAHNRSQPKTNAKTDHLGITAVKPAITIRTGKRVRVR
jgi:hypothetical protein